MSLVEKSKKSKRLEEVYHEKVEIYEEEDREIMEKYEESWRAIFEAAELDDIYEEISWQSLKDPKSKVTKLVLFLYSMETFIPYELNRASREQDQSKVHTLGPFACLLKFIIESANANRRIGNY